MTSHASYTERFEALCENGHLATWHVTSDSPTPRVECADCTANARLDNTPANRKAHR